MVKITSEDITPALLGIIVLFGVLGAIDTAGVVIPYFEIAGLAFAGLVLWGVASLFKYLSQEHRKE